MSNSVQDLQDPRPLIARLSHDSRNILQRAQGALERLRWRLPQQPEILALLARLQQAQDDLSLLMESARDLVQPVALDRQPHELSAVWRAAWGALGEERQRKGARLDECTEGVDLVCDLDRRRLTQAFRYLLQSALAACPEPARIAVTCRAADLDGRPALVVAVCDNGPVAAAEQLRHFFEPLAAPPARRHALGLAVARKIIEAHGGRVEARPAPDQGVETLVTLPRRNP
jgi:signal transduction histidine kinase